MKIVADTNTFLAVSLNEPERDQIIELTRGHELIAPSVLSFEIGNALSALFKRNILRKEEVNTVWHAIQNIPVEVQSVDIKSSLTIAVDYMIYAYDAFFLDCALKNNSHLLTLDCYGSRYLEEWFSNCFPLKPTTPDGSRVRAVGSTENSSGSRG